MKNFRIGIFSTFRDRAALELFRSVHQACKDGFIRGTLSFVFCNRERGEFPKTDEYLSYVESCGVPLVSFSSRKFRTEERKKALHDRVLMRKWRIEYDRTGPGPVAQKYQPDLIVLAGYMLILAEEMCERWRMINLHPALPWGPKGSWEEVIWELIRTGQRETGAMMHLVTKDLDRGPPLSFYKVPLKGLKPLWLNYEKKLETADFHEVKRTEYRTNELFCAIREKQLPGEVPLILLTLKYVAEGVIEVRETNGAVFINGRPREHGMKMDKEVESFLNTRLK